MFTTLKTKVFPILWSLLLCVMLLISVIDFFSFRLSYYEKMYQINQSASHIQISQEDLMESTIVLLDYLRDDRDNLDINVEINNETVPMFNEREISHMVDVKDLYQNAMTVRNISFVVFILLSLFLFYENSSYFLLEGFKRTLLILGLILIFIVSYAVIDFNSFWNDFHHIFFTNDLWILDPRVDRLINMVPLNFFNGLVTRIIITYGLLLASVMGGLKLWKTKTK